MGNAFMKQERESSVLTINRPVGQLTFYAISNSILLAHGSDQSVETYRSILNAETIYGTF